MAGYSANYDLANGFIYGPTSQPAAGLPGGVYLQSLDDLYAYNAAVRQINQAASDAAESLAQAAVSPPSGTPATGNVLADITAQQIAAYQAALAAATAASKAATTPAPATPPKTIPGLGATTSPKLAPRVSFGGGQASYCDIYPDDPLCDLWDPIGYGGGGVYGSGGGQITIIEQGGGVSAADINTFVDDGLNGLWSNITGAVDAVIGAVIGELQNAITALGKAIKAAYGKLAKLAGLTITALKTILRDLLKGIKAALRELRDIFEDAYNKLLLPLLKKLQQWRKTLLDWYTRFIRPVLIVLQNMRKILRILELFHVPFAAKLDRALTSIQAKITQPLFILLGYINGLANYLNLILTARYLLQKPLWLWSMKAYAGESINLQLNAMNPGSSPADLAALQAAGRTPTAAQASADAQTFLTAGTGPMADTINNPRYSLDAALATIGAGTTANG